MNEQNYTSLNLSKKLAEAGCEFESEYVWQKYSLCNKPALYPQPLAKTAVVVLSGKVEFSYPAYDILNDICVRYAKEFFGDKDHSYEIMIPILKGKKQEAEDYIWEHCLFNSKNKV